MSWKSTEEKKRFFEELDRAFNTPPSQTLILPQLNRKTTAKPLIKQPSPTFLTKRKSIYESQHPKRRKVSVENTNTTGVGIRPIRQEKSKPVKRPPPVKTRSSESQKQSDEKISELLSGMVLFFIPNSKKNGVRRYRMNLFARHGADVRDVWSDEITHVICDKSITGERVMRDLRWEQLPVYLSKRG